MRVLALLLGLLRRERKVTHPCRCPQCGGSKWDTMGGLRVCHACGAVRR